MISLFGWKSVFIVLTYADGVNLIGDDIRTIERNAGVLIKILQ